jgi:hypothetical protein
MATKPILPSPTSSPHPSLPPVDGIHSDSDRRDSKRFMTIFRAGKITHHGRENLCLVRNISRSGAMAQIFQDLCVDDRIFLDLRLEERIIGRVVWIRGELVGIAFSQDIDLAEVLRSELDHGHRRRAPRVTVDATGRLQVGDEFLPVAIDNVSQTGTRIFCPRHLPTGTEVRLWVDGLGAMPSFVRWTKDSIVGLAFLKSLSIWELTTWVREQAIVAAIESQPEV